MSKILAVFGLLGFWCAAFARPLEVRFSTLPPDCTVVDRDRPDSGSGTGSLVVPDLAPGQPLRFLLMKPGYNSLEVTISAAEIPSSGTLVWPPQPGSFLRLEPLLVTATFFTAPPGAQIWTSRTGKADDYLGTTGHPVLLNLADLLGSEHGSFRVRLVAPGYRTVEVPVPEHLFGTGRPNRWPAEGEYALSPTGGVLAPLVFMFRLKPWSVAMFGILGVSALALLVRLGHRAWSSVTRARAIEGRTAAAGAELSGSRLGPYRLYEMLGKGATATVFRAGREGEGTDRSELAVKVFHLGTESATRLAVEVKPLLELRHPNLVSLLDWGQSEGFAYLVTELVPGRSLREELRHGALELEAWRALVDDLLGGLSYAHGRGVVHGDIKPENVLLPLHGKAKLIDFGLARHMLRPGLERFGGTPGYMAPELGQEQGPTAATDQYAAGTLLFEALYGVFPGNPDWRPERHGEILPILDRMRQADPKARYAEVEEARQALRAVRVSR